MDNSITFLHKRDGSEQIIVCVPPAGTGARFFQQWVAAADRSSDLIVVELPGRGKRLFDAPLMSIQQAAHLVADQILSIERAADRPLVLFGHSMGAWIAYEIALYLHSTKREMSILAVSACPPPGDRISAATGLTYLNDADFMSELQKRFGEIPELAAASPAVRRLMLPAMRNDLVMCENYTPTAIKQMPLGCPISTFVGIDDCVVSSADVAAWAMLTSGHCRFRTFPGGHLFIKDCAEQVLSAIEADVTLFAR